MNAPRTITIFLAVTILSLGLVIGVTAFTPTEKATIQAMKARITALEAGLATLEDNQVAMDEFIGEDIDVLEANDLILSGDIETLDAGLKGLTSDTGPMRQLNDEILALDARIDEIVPPIALTGIKPIVTCTTTTCTVQVEWFSDPPATGQIEWGATTAYGTKGGLETGLLPYHKQTVGTFAKDGKVYHFRILATTPGAATASDSTGFVVQ